MSLKPRGDKLHEHLSVDYDSLDDDLEESEKPIEKSHLPHAPVLSSSYPDVGNISYTVKSVIESDGDTDIFCMRYSPDNQFLLLGCGDGQMRVFSASSGKVHYQWSTAGKSMIKLPVTAVRFRPVVEGDQKAKHIVLVAGSGGIVQHWHLTSGRMLNSITEKGNQVYAVDYRQDARLFATAGKDSFVRIYDESTKQVINTMSGGNGVSTAGHANRIFTIKFHPYDDNVVLTGGWDNTIQVWDVRTQHAIKRIFGPHICGDALDIDYNQCVLAGSWRPDHQLQLFDFGTARLIEDIKVTQESSASQPCNIYSCQFSDQSGNLIAYGGSGNNQAKIISRNSGKIVGAVTGLEKAVYSLTFSPDQRHCAVGGGDGNIYVLQSNGK